MRLENLLGAAAGATFAHVLGAGVLGKAVGAFIGWEVTRIPKQSAVSGALARPIAVPRQHFDDWSLNNRAAELLGAVRKLRREFVTAYGNGDGFVQALPTYSEYEKRAVAFSARVNALADRSEDADFEQDLGEFHDTFNQAAYGTGLMYPDARPGHERHSIVTLPKLRRGTSSSSQLDALDNYFATSTPPAREQLNALDRYFTASEGIDEEEDETGVFFLLPLVPLAVKAANEAASGKRRKARERKQEAIRAARETEKGEKGVIKADVKEAKAKAKAKVKDKAKAAKAGGFWGLGY